MDDPLVKDGAAQLILPVGSRDHVQGSEEAAVTLLEYADFECRHCAEAFPMVKEITRWLRGELRYAFRHFPDADRHPHALRAAEAAEAVGAQGKFWEMHDLLCERSPVVDAIHLELYAQELGLDVGRFAREMRVHAYLEKVREDMTSGAESGVKQTPTFFVNGLQYKGEADIDGLLAAIEEAGNQVIGGGNRVARQRSRH
jgi:protein-disulfide isomerase